MLSPVNRSVLRFLLLFLTRFYFLPVFGTCPALFERVGMSLNASILTSVWKFAQVILRGENANADKEKYLVLKKLIEATRMEVAGVR